MSTALKAPDNALRWPNGGISISTVSAPDGRVLDLHNVIFPATGTLVWLEGDTLHIQGSEVKSYKGTWSDV